MDYFCNGCGLSGSDYSKLGDKLLLLSGSWFEHIPDVCDECAEVDSETYAAAVEFNNAAITFKEPVFLKIVVSIKIFDSISCMFYNSDQIYQKSGNHL